MTTLTTEQLRAHWECEGPHHNNEDPIADIIYKENMKGNTMSTPSDSLRTACDKYWDPDTRLVSKLKRGSGITLDYVDHATVTRMLIDIDPLWTWEPMGINEHGQPIIDTDDNGAPRAIWIYMTVHGKTIPAVGTIERPGMKGYGDALKELIGDALRNGALRFGVCGGLWARSNWDDATSPVAPTMTSILQELDADKRKKVKESLNLEGTPKLADIITALTNSGFDMDKQTIDAWLEERTQ